MEPVIQTPEATANNKLIAMIMFWFLVTFAVARLIVYLVVDRLLPNMFLTIRGVHIHHFTYGVVILAVTNLFFILKRPTPDQPIFKWLTVAYGIGLGLTFDEFGMWVRLEDNYWIRQSYDAVIIVALLLLNILYFRPLKRAFHEIVEITKNALTRS